jgi:hypothetical protein
MGALDASLSQMQADTLSPNTRAPRHWNRGVWIRFVLAITPTVVLAILGYLQTH